MKTVYYETFLLGFIIKSQVVVLSVVCCVACVARQHAAVRWVAVASIVLAAGVAPPAGCLPEQLGSLVSVCRGWVS